jgi:hypothetical protein
LRNAGGLLKSIAANQWSLARERIAVILRMKQDPFDSYKWLDDIHDKYNLHPLYFFLVAKKNRGYDKNISPNNSTFKRLIKKHASNYLIGIHPSWQSGEDLRLIQNEIEFLETASESKIFRSRQHYIKLKLPQTYRLLINAGITEDFSMGYGSINGFRASYCLPYKWYDLEKETTTSLVIYPFCYMDANSFFEQHLTPEEALLELEHYYTVTRDVSGLLITIWHNQFLGNDKMFKGWKEIYEAFIKKHFKK